MKKLGPYFLAGFLIVVVSGYFVARNWMQQPLGPRLDLDTSAASVASPTLASAPQTTGVAPVAAAPTATAFPSKKACGREGSLSIMVIGEGLIENGGFLKVGAIRLVVVDFDRAEARVLTLPSELWVDARVLKDPANPTRSLDLIYQVAYDAAGNVPKETAHIQGTRATAQAILDTFGFAPDNYLTVLQQPFVDLVNTLDGIDITLPEALDDGHGHTYPSGLQHLDGATTLELTRIDPLGRPNPDHWGRFARQKLVSQALLTEVLKPEHWTQAPQLAQQARQAVLTDLSPDQGLDLVCMVQLVGSQAKLVEVPPSLITVDAQNRWLPDIDAVKGLISGLLAQ